MASGRIICDACGLRLWPEQVAGSACPECGGALRPMARLEALVDRWFAPLPQVASALHRRHLQLVELMWTADGRGHEFYDLVRPKGVSYDRFVDRVNEIVCKGLAEGWISAEIPPAPVPDDRAYQIHFARPDRFADEVMTAFTQPGAAPDKEPLSQSS